MWGLVEAWRVGSGRPGDWPSRAAADAWRAFPPMPTGRHGLGAAAAGGRIYVLSGGPTPGFSFSDLNEVLDLGTR